MLVVSHKLLNFILSVLLVDTVLLGTTRGKRHQGVDEHLSSIVRLNTIGEEGLSVVNESLTDLFGQSLVLLLAEALHDLAQLEGTALVHLFQSSLHEHRVEAASCALGLQLYCGPFKLANLLNAEQMERLKCAVLDAAPHFLRVVTAFKSQVESQVDQDVVVEVGDDVHQLGLKFLA